MEQGLIVNTMSSLEIAEATGKQHKHVMEAIRTMEPAWEKISGSKFRLASYKDAQGKDRPCYNLTKTECLYVATKFNDEARAKLVLRWEALETGKATPAYQLPKSYAEALRELAGKVEENERLALENKQQAEKIQKDAPKVTYFEAFMKSAHGSKSIGIREVVKQAHIKSEKKFIQWMQDRRILFRQKKDGRLQPYAEYARCFDSVDVYDQKNDWSGKQLLMNPFGKMKIVRRYHDEQPTEFEDVRDMFNS